MSKLDFPGELADKEPPPPARELSVGAHLDDYMGQFDVGLGTSYANPGRELCVSASALDLEIRAEVNGDELARWLQPPAYESIDGSSQSVADFRKGVSEAMARLEHLEKSISEAMARTAMKYGVDLSPDSEYDYPVFISPAKDGEIGIMFRDPQIAAMLIGRRSGSTGESLVIESHGVLDALRFQVLLGGLGVLLVAIETN